MSHHQQSSAAADAVLRGQQRQQLAGMSAFDRHKKFMHDYLHYYGGKLATPQQTVKTDYDTLKEQYRFIRSEEDDVGNSWEVRLAHKYYAKLFKEYAIIDLSRYKEAVYGMRWRTEKEVIAGRGQFTCGAKGCDQRQGLASFEVPFGYHEAGKQKQALVKVRLCPEHALQLNYRKNKEALKAQKRARREDEEREERRRKRKKQKSSLATPQAANTDSRQADLGKGAAEASPASEPIAVSADAEKDTRRGQAATEGPDIGRLESKADHLAAQNPGGTKAEQLEPSVSGMRAVEEGRGRDTAARGKRAAEGGSAKREDDGLDRRKGISEDDRWQMAGSRVGSKDQQDRPDRKGSPIDDDTLFADLFL